MQDIIKVLVGISLNLMAQVIWARSTELTIFNQQKVVAQLQLQTSMPIIIPHQIPKSLNYSSLYVSFTGQGNQPNYNHFWQINWDTTFSCQGVRICNIGFISAEKNGHLKLYYTVLPQNEQKLKQEVRLTAHLTGFYTPFHVEASGVSPTLEWRYNHILYTLSWKIPGGPAQQKQELISIALSALT